MKSSCIDYQETGSFSPVITDYLEQDPKLAPFYNFAPTITGFQQLIEQRKTNKIAVNRDLLVQVLKEQYLNNPASVQVNQNIELLSKENTYTITTGHQLNIFTGPLYFIFKIVTSINLANDLKKALPDYNFVPVYWMATEDHDFAEINHTYVDGRKLSWDMPATGATGRLNTESIAQVVKEYQNILGASDNAEKLSKIIGQAYNDHPLLADATRYLANALFEKYGLVILDADNKQLKQSFAAVIEQDIIGQNSFREINKSSEKLEKAGYKTGVNAREINFFYLDEGLRERIIYKDGKYNILNTSLSFSEEELRKEIHSNPEKFSPNVILRPLYQEMILPNLAYIGGGSEIAYWLQLKENFDFYNVSFPILILRNSALIADETIEAKLLKSDLTFKDIFKDLEILKKEWVMSHSEHDLTLNNEWKELQATFEKIKERSSKIDPTLAPSAEAVSARLHKVLLSLEKKLVRAEKRNYSTALSQIEGIKTKLFPGGSLQERKENFGLFYVTYGDEFIPELMKHFKPLDFKFTILY
ncbi:MAG TPA: bacillithiol biosynthesis cysteine-adding enzyme BshC [Sphingobacteriaceae bacterium]|nr:bacillithiol biosynthesis cysteine-adding enzyme BshC [Sphingobacteriaceae bacterium]